MVTLFNSTRWKKKRRLISPLFLNHYIWINLSLSRFLFSVCRRQQNKGSVCSSGIWLVHGWVFIAVLHNCVLIISLASDIRHTSFQQKSISLSGWIKSCHRILKGEIKSNKKKKFPLKPWKWDPSPQTPFLHQSLPFSKPTSHNPLLRRLKIAQRSGGGGVLRRFVGAYGCSSQLLSDGGVGGMFTLIGT